MFAETLQKDLGPMAQNQTSASSVSPLDRDRGRRGLRLKDPPAQQLFVVGDTQTEQRVATECGQRLVGAPQQQTDTLRMFQQHGRYLVFEFLEQELGEIEDPHIPVAGRQRIAGRHSDVVDANQPGHSIILAAARQLG
jgi:hypothetical protein